MKNQGEETYYSGGQPSLEVSEISELSDKTEKELRREIEQILNNMRNQATNLSDFMENRASLAALELHLHPEKTEQYEYFKQLYVSGHQGVLPGKQRLGQPQNESGYILRSPRVIREKNGKEIEYDMVLLSAMTESASHLVQVRRTSMANISQEDSYFVVTFDFGTGDFYEWPVQEVRVTKKQRHGEIGRPYMPPSIDLVLYTPEDEFIEANSQKPADYIHQIHDRLVDRQIDSLRDAHSIILHLADDGSRTSLSWGNFSKKAMFHDIFTIDNELIYLREAEDWGITHLQDQGSKEKNLDALRDLVCRRFVIKHEELFERWQIAWSAQGLEKQESMGASSLIGRIAYGRKDD